MLETNLLTYWNVCGFVVVHFMIYDTNTRMTFVFNVTITMNNIVVIIRFTNSDMEYRINIYTSYIGSTIIKSDYINLQVLFTSSIAIFDGLFNICMHGLTQLVLNRIVSSQNAYKSYYTFIYGYYCAIALLSMTLSLINQLGLMRYNTIDVAKSTSKGIHDKYTQIIESHECMHCVSINDILILIIYSIYSFYTAIHHLFIEIQTLIHVFSLIFIVFIRYIIIILYYQFQWNVFRCTCEKLDDAAQYHETIRNVDINFVMDWMYVFCDWGGVFLNS